MGEIVKIVKPGDAPPDGGRSAAVTPCDAVSAMLRAPLVGADIAAARLVICRECALRGVDRAGIEYCKMLGCSIVSERRSLRNLVAHAENLPPKKGPHFGCFHTQRALGKGWFLPAGSRTPIAAGTPSKPVEPPQPPLLFNAAGKPLDLAGFYRGRSAFLILGGPSFGKLDTSKLRRAGALTIGVNNSAKSFRPDLWTCVDSAEHFIRSVWHDPRILKLAPEPIKGGKIFDSDAWKFTGKRVADCPSVVYYRRHCGFVAETFLSEQTVCWGNDDKTGGGRSVMLAAIRLLYYLGVRRIFLLGCDFKMAGNYAYHFEQKREEGSVKGNNDTYKTLCDRFAQLRPIFEGAGLTVLNCNPESGLRAFDFAAFDKALDLVAGEFGRINLETERTAALYDTAKPGGAAVNPAPKAAPVAPSKPATKNTFWSEQLQLPALAHFIFLGARLPASGKAFIERFRRINPTFEARLHQALPLDFPADLHRHVLTVENHATRADFVRLHLVNTLGGFYLDNDVWSFRSFEELRHYRNLFMGIGNQRINNAVFADVPGGEATVELLRRLRAQHLEAGNPAIVDQGGKVWSQFYGAGPALFTLAGQERPEIFNVAPEHWFQIAWGFKNREPFILAPTAEKLVALFARDAGKLTDGVWPFALHGGSDADQKIFPDPTPPRIKPVGRASELLRRLPLDREIAGAEIGVFAGAMSGELLAFAPRLRLTMVDPWREADPRGRYAASKDGVAKLSQARMDQVAAEAMETVAFAGDRASIRRGFSLEVAPTVPDASLDFVFVDADHSYEGCREDCLAWLPKIKPGGLLAGHDIDYAPRPEWGVRRAAEEVAAKIGADSETGADHTFFIRLPGGA